MGVTRKSVQEAERQTAYHEAAHAVIAWTFGIGIDGVSIEADEDYTGICRISHVDGLTGDPYRDTPEYDLLSAYAYAVVAGEVAVAILTSRSPDWSTWIRSGGSDIDQYTDLAFRLGWYERGDGREMDLRPHMGEAERRVRRLLRSRWRAVKGLAETLLQEGTLDGAGAVRLIVASDVPGPIADVDEAFRRERLEVEARRERLRSGGGG